MAFLISRCADITWPVELLVVSGDEKGNDYQYKGCWQRTLEDFRRSLLSGNTFQRASEQRHCGQNDDIWLVVKTKFLIWRKKKILLYFFFETCWSCESRQVGTHFASIKHFRPSERVTSKHFFWKCKHKTITVMRYSTQACWKETLFKVRSVFLTDPSLKTASGRRKVFQPVSTVQVLII